MTTKSKAKSAPKPKAKAKAEPKPEAPVAEVEQAEVTENEPKAQHEAQADRLSASELALLGREFRTGNQDRQSVLDAHDRYLAQSGNDPKDVDFAKRHKRVIELLPQ